MAVGYIRFVNAKEFSTIHLNELFVSLSELFDYQKVMATQSSQVYATDTKIHVQSSIFQKVQILHWKFDIERVSNLTNLIILCPNNYNVMLQKGLRDVSMKVFL